MDEREKLAADLLWAERCIQRCRDPAVAAAAKVWLAELERQDLKLSGGVRCRP